MIRILLITVLLFNIYIKICYSFSISNINTNIIIKCKKILVSSVAASLLLSNDAPSQADDGVARETTSITASSSSKVRRLPAYWNVFERLDFTENAIDEIKNDIDEIEIDIKDMIRRSDAREEAMIARMERDKREADESRERDKKEANDRMDQADVRMIWMFGITTSIALMPTIKLYFENKS